MQISLTRWTCHIPAAREIMFDIIWCCVIGDSGIHTQPEIVTPETNRHMDSSMCLSLHLD